VAPSALSSLELLVPVQFISTLTAIVGTLTAIVGTLTAIVSALNAIVGTLNAIVGTLNAIVGTLTAIVGTLTAIVSALMRFIVSAPMRFIVSALSDCGGSVSVEERTARAGALPGSWRGTGVRCRSGAEMIVLLLLEMGILRQACTPTHLGRPPSSTYPCPSEYPLVRCGTPRTPSASQVGRRFLPQAVRSFERPYWPAAGYCRRCIGPVASVARRAVVVSIAAPLWNTTQHNTAL
jgi:hypothetical protein